GFIVGSLDVARRLRLADVNVVVDAPRRVTVGEPVTFTIACSRSVGEAAKHSDKHPIRVRGPFLPWDGKWLDEAPPEIVIPDGDAARAQATMRARFVA